MVITISGSRHLAVFKDVTLKWIFVGVINAGDCTTLQLYNFAARRKPP